ncbi:inositol monophosphatase family protein [Marinospirillum alkaliphilum]|uniref:Myo-inositol-1(Or 4)-monophosphatase n=1 Tax=Marinospirillum alkaliphilum DSM 21637 TaxID=1122209 RepID=A0A1K1UYY8_9GAMM|nr:inositol monophosphatase family protein [Marinospirillum alkaliphilum]SFX17772.1 myo-inositol-1(or 4)-monophosphatase [Marinospirillum alkaliphilum DSM 21637]
MHPTIQLALRAVRSVGEHYEYVSERLDLARVDNALTELLENCGRRVEQALERQLVRAHPDASFQGRSVQLKGSGDMSWVVNPLLGYENLERGYPAFALSLAIFLRGKLEHVIIFNPATGQEYLASRGRGATLNGRRIRVLSGWKAEKAAVAFPLPAAELRQQLFPVYLNLLPQVGMQALHASGCVALDICAVAAGQLEAGIFLGADESELAPALLVLKEAGGLYGDLSGAPALTAEGRLLVTNPKAFRQLVSQLKPHLV